MKLSRLLVPALAAIAVGCGPGHNYEQASIYGAAIRPVLIARGLCRDQQDCSHKEMILVEGGTFSSSPVHVNVYNVADPNAADALVEAVRSVRSSAKVGVELRITASRHLDTPYKHVRRVKVE